MLKFVLYLIITSQLLASASFAQTTSGDVDDSFDPFADYNEFEQQTDEEADINFLRNGRYLTLGVVAGYRGYIGGGLSQAYKGALDYGFEFNYFFDLNVAGSIAYVTGDHAVNFVSPSRQYSGNVNIQMIDMQMKYYFNTDNVTRGLADLNPYGVIGGGYYIRTYSLSEELNEDPDKVAGIKIGGGIELPLLKRRAYIGFQGLYRYVQFPDENKRFILEGTNNPQPVTPQLDGDIYELNVILGLNF